MDGISIIAVVGMMVGPLYPLVIHNAIQSRLNKKLLERLNGKTTGETLQKEGKNARN